MGRWIVVILASVLTMGILLAFFPTLHNVAFHVGQYGIKWAILVGLGVTYTYHRFTE